MPIATDQITGSIGRPAVELAGRVLDRVMRELTRRVQQTTPQSQRERVVGRVLRKAFDDAIARINAESAATQSEEVHFDFAVSGSVDP